MINSQPGTVKINVEDSEVLRQRFVLLAQCAAETSNGAHEETVLAATMMADLLTIAAMFREDSATAERADEIVEFCKQRALPLLTDAADDASLKCLVQDADDRWSECLTLLSPEERFSCQPVHDWIDTDNHGWTESLKADAAETFHAAEVESDGVSGNRQQPLNIAGILAALAGETDPSDDQTLYTADAEKHHAASQTVENSSTNALSDFDDQPLPIPPGELESIDDPEMVAAYADDAQQCIAEMEASLLGLESGQDADVALRSFSRQLHTLKGASGTVGLSRLAKYLHDLESYIEKTAGCQIDVDKLLDCIDAVRAQLSALGISGVGVAAVAASSPKAVSEQPAPGQAPSPSVTPGNDNELFVRVEASRLERLMDLLAELVMLRNRRDTYVDSLRTIHRELNYCAARTRTLTSTIEYTMPATTATTNASSLDVESERSTAKSRLLSRTLDEVSKDTAELGRSLQEVFDPLSDDNSAVSHLIGQFRQELMELRRLPIGGLFQRLQRVVRDAAKSEGKLVEVVFEGQGARAERAVQERLFEPLLHLVRNAVSHGLDTPDGRLKTGKPAVGRITLAARSDAASLCIEVRDDGKGLNDEALESRGRELGLLPSGESVSRSQLWKLIFHPGFSTKSAVSEISGRGVGMDVVDSWVKRLRGRIDVESLPGQGTTIRLHIPLRSAVEHAMVVRAGGQLFALPMHTVSGTSDSKQPTRGRANSASDTQIISLSHILGCKSNQTVRGCSISLRSNSGTARTTQHRADDLTIAVDAIVGVEEVVVRALPPLLQRNELFVGVTLSGRAETVLLLDVRKVIDLCQRTERRDDENTTPVPTDGASLKHANSQRCVLVVDDSVVVRRSVSRKLRAAGYEVREAANGREALVTLYAGGITAVVTDLDMPGMTGVELLQEIKRQKQFKAIPVTVLTSRDDESMLTEIRQLHPAAVLHKPVTDGTIKAILDSLTCSDVTVS
ncbi:MAG: response regulator [Fuerstia sp.]|nr:response regulator [Fuerstiella sp.]